MAERCPMNGVTAEESCGLYPPIGQLKPHHLKAPFDAPLGATEYLYEIIERRYGIRKEEIFQKMPSRCSSHWSEVVLLKVAILCMEGWTNERIAQAFDDESGPDSIVSNESIRTHKCKYLTGTVRAIADRNKSVATSNSILRPESRETESKIKAIEHYFGLERTEIFSEEILSLNRLGGIYQPDWSISIVYDRVIRGMSAREVDDKVVSSTVGRDVIKDSNRVAVLFCRLLTKKAKEIYRQKKGWKPFNRSGRDEVSAVSSTAETA